MTLRAILFDVDGTIAETEEVHRAAWNAAFADHGLDWHWNQSRYGELLAIAGGVERLRHFAGDRLSDGECRAIHATKNGYYRHMLANRAVPPRPGVAELIDAARSEGIRLGIATTTSRDNVEALLTGIFGAEALGWFTVTACAEDAAAKKPDPAVYRVALARIGCQPGDVVAIEDSRNGLRAALSCGLNVILTPSLYFPDEDASGALLVIENLSRVGTDSLLGLLDVNVNGVSVT